MEEYRGLNSVWCTGEDEARESESKWWEQYVKKTGYRSK